MTELTPLHQVQDLVVPKMQFRFRIVAEVASTIPIEATGADELGFIPITGGRVTGKLSGAVVEGGGDWCLRRNDGSYAVDARYGIRSDTGAYIDVHNTGVLIREDGIEYFMTTPTFRTVDPDLVWLTRSLFVGRAHVGPGATTIDVFELTRSAKD
ncbi:hypothetical protein J2Y66_003656 [Paenarthrobacter nitroguajacolicus]|uniref:DUF3237 domain-containing protein n=1 Tax=Paenarthrobacter nitroguajacolicus TaxID=211146 RepID=UPI002860D3BD|nr:DUF3237 domain-containing protein [Paenarthrobacter nitroguajacolicus]MDR6989141.1 hypothetical protein [Paenarthrobacter nitroguajacolicus]